MKIFVLLLGLGILIEAAPPKHVVFVLGDHEYSGEETMPLLARELQKDARVRCTVLRSAPDQNAETDIPGLEALRSADLAVFFLRWRRLPAEQVAHIEAYVRSGKPMIGLRTTSHAFRYPQGHPLEHWNRWAAEAFGAPPGWGADGHTHFGHRSSTDVEIVPGSKTHPVLSGISGPFHVRSWLYRVRPKWPPKDAALLLTGTAVNPDKPAEPNPVAWIWRNPQGGRVFFTTLGHPEDFAVEPVQRLVVNAIFWGLRIEPPRWKGPLPIQVPYRGIVDTAK
jgi:type 1 glutamine amidotransferase